MYPLGHHPFQSPPPRRQPHYRIQPEPALQLAHAQRDLPDILRHADNVISQQTRMRQGFYERNQCKLFAGDARFIDANTVSVSYMDGTSDTIRADHIVIACGSRPYHPASVDFNHPRIYDSDSILELSHEPRHVIIYGAGVIGCEYASIFRGLNVKVDLINTRDRLLAFLDQEMSDSLSYHFWNNGVVIRHNESSRRLKVPKTA